MGWTPLFICDFCLDLDQHLFQGPTTQVSLSPAPHGYRVGGDFPLAHDQHHRDLLQLRLSNPGASLRGIAQLLEENRVPTARGGTWGPSGVRNVLQRLSVSTS